MSRVRSRFLARPLRRHGAAALLLLLQALLVTALGQTTTAVCSSAVVRCFGLSIENGRRVGCRSLLLLGGASAFALVLGQYPYLYLTVAFIQMLKAFSPTRRSG